MTEFLWLLSGLIVGGGFAALGERMEESRRATTNHKVAKPKP